MDINEKTAKNVHSGQVHSINCAVQFQANLWVGAVKKYCEIDQQ
jgi:hypothetical protein